MQYKIFDNKHERMIFGFPFFELALISIIMGPFMIIINHLSAYILLGAIVAFAVVGILVCWIIDINTYPKSFIHKDSELIVYDGRKREMKRFDLNQCTTRRHMYIYVLRKYMGWSTTTPQESLIISTNAKEKDNLLKIKEINYEDHRKNPNVLIVQNPESIAFIESIMQGQQPQEENTTA